MEVKLVRVLWIRPALQQVKDSCILDCLAVNDHCFFRQDTSVIEVPVETKKAVRRNPRPKHLSFDLLQIGQFLAARNLATKTPNHNKLKIHFGLE